MGVALELERVEDCIRDCVITHTHTRLATTPVEGEALHSGSPDTHVAHLNSRSQRMAPLLADFGRHGVEPGLAVVLMRADDAELFGAALSAMIIEGATQIIERCISNNSAVRSLAEDEAVIRYQKIAQVTKGCQGYVRDG